MKLELDSIAAAGLLVFLGQPKVKELAEELSSNGCAFHFPTFISLTEDELNDQLEALKQAREIVDNAKIDPFPKVKVTGEKLKEKRWHRGEFTSYITRDRATGEYKVRLKESNKILRDSDYFTDCIKDAQATAYVMVNQAYMKKRQDEAGI